MEKAKWAIEGVINDESIAAHRARLGTVLRTGGGLNDCANRRAIANFASAIGDPNPLWSDESYASKSPYGGIVAPPSWPYSVTIGVVMQGLKGVHGFHGGSDWEFHRPILVGDAISAECRFVDLEEKQSEFSPRWLMEHYRTEFHNQRAELVASLTTRNVRAERKRIKEGGTQAKTKFPHPWTEKELAGIEEEVLAEKIRGSEVRYWEDVKIDDDIPPLVKGPLSITDITSWHAATRQVYGGSVALRQYRRHPGLAMLHPDTHAHEAIEIVHFDRKAAETVGLAYPYDLGSERHAWLLQSVTHWIGDHGWTKKNSAEYRKFVYLSDVLWIRGKVTRTYVDSDGEHCVDVVSKAVNQRGEDVMTGKFVVALPSRDKGWWPLTGRLARPHA